MEILQIEGSWKSPHIILDPSGIFEIWGRSLPENVIDIYTPVLAWLDAYAKQPAPQTNIEVKLEYFNTSSSKLLYEIFKRFENIKKAGNNINVKWYFESDDADLEEDGKMFADLVNVPIEMVSVEEFEFTFQ
jgi:hypothetical protein